MADPLVDTTDVEAALVRPLTDSEQPFVERLCEQASDLLRVQRPFIDAQILSGARSQRAIAAVLAPLIAEGVSNPGGGLASKSETVGPFSRSWSYASQRGNGAAGLTITAAVLAKIDATGFTYRAPFRTVPFQPPAPAIAASSPAPVPVLPGHISVSELDTRIEEHLMAYTPSTTDVTKISGAIVPIASSASSAALTFGRQHLVTGSAAQTLTIATPTVNGTTVSVKVDDAYTGAGVTMPTGMQQAGVLVAGQDFDWFWNGTAWSIE